MTPRDDEPLRERLWAVRMVALARTGRQAEALASYRQLHHLLENELGVRPGSAVQELHQSLLRQEPVSLPPVATRRSSVPRPVPVMPSVRWTRSSGVHIAYQVLGNGPVDLLWIPSYLSHLELHWQCPPYADLLSTLAQHSRLVVMDKRGVGLSDREHTADLNERAADVQAVLDAVGSAKAVVLASSEGAASAVPFCVRHPERVAGLVLFGSLPSLIAPDFPVGLAAEQYLEHMTWLYDNWGTGRSLESFAPSAAHDPASVAWYARMERDAITPGGLLQMVRTSAAVSYVHLLPQIRVPTLVLHRSNEPVPVEAARLAALLIPGARMVELDGVDHLMWFGDTGPVLNEVRRVLDDALSAPSHG